MNVSVAMATYNGANYIGEQLASLAAQTKQPAEVVVCDDGSTDCTLEIVEKWAIGVPFPVHVHCNEDRLGHENNFWKAANLCVGELIAFCDQDDVWLKNKLEYCVPPFSNPEILLVMHSAKLVDSDLSFLGKNLPDIKRARVASSLDVNPWDSAPGFSLVFSAALLRSGDWRSRPEDHLGPGRPMGHDHWIYLMASVLGCIKFVPDALALYRRHQNNTTSPVDRTMKTFLQRGIHTGEGVYRHLANLSLGRSEYLSQIAEGTDSDVKKQYKKASVYYQQLHKTLMLRALLHSSETRLREKLSCIIRLLRRKAYRSLDRGGLGTRAFAKDIVFSIIRH